MRLKNNTLDLVALTSSLLCAFHCATIPIVLSFTSLGSLHFLENPYVEWSFITLGVLFVFIILWPSYKKIHHELKPLIFASIGFAFIAIGRLEFSELWEVSNTVTGALLVSTAHYFNWRSLRHQGCHKH